MVGTISARVSSSAGASAGSTAMTVVVLDCGMVLLMGVGKSRIVLIMPGGAMGGIIGVCKLMGGSMCWGSMMVSGMIALSDNGMKVVRQHGCDQKQVDLPGFEASSCGLADPLTRKCCFVRKSIGA